MTEMRALVWPVYLVADESGSMEDDVGEVNRGLTSLLDALQSDPFKASKARFCVLGFDYEVRQHLPLSDLRDVERMPVLSTRKGTTVYSKVFRDLRSRIDADVANLRNNHFGVNRPAIFFLSDGVPDDGDPWESALAELKDPSFPRRPNILTFGIGAADPRTILAVATREEYAYMAAKGTDTGLAIVRFFDSLTRSMESSTQAMGSGKAQLQIEKPEGFTLAVDLVD